MRTRPDPSGDPGRPPTYITADTHWWDGSQIYGSDPAFAHGLRSGEHGKLRIDELGLPPSDLEQHIDLAGVAGNFWVGLALLHSLFMREHNAICDRLHAEYPQMTDQELYDKARLVNAALMAKIHTVDWTPAIIAHPTTVLGMRTNWYGLPGEHFDKLFGRVTSDEVIHGIPGSATNHHGVPYSLTEEFVAVYRMHPLIPDDFLFRSVRGRQLPAAAHAAGSGRARGAKPAQRDADGRHLLLLRPLSPGRHHAAQLPEVPAALRPPRRRADRPGLDRRAAHARARRAPLQRVPAAVPPRPGLVVRAADRQPGLGRGAARRCTATSSGSI